MNKSESRTKLYIESKASGEKLLNEAGYEIGQTVYMDGKHEAIIKYAYSYDSIHLESVDIEMDVELFQSIRPEFEPSGHHTKVLSKCHLGNFTAKRKTLL